MRKKAWWAPIDSRWPDIADRHFATLGTPVQQPLMLIKALRMLRYSHSITVIMTLEVVTVNVF